LNRLATQVKELPGLSSAPQPHLLAGRLCSHPGQLVTQPEVREAACAVGADLESRAHLAKLRGLFKHGNLKAAPNQSQRTAQAADAGTGNEDSLRGRRHVGYSSDCISVLMRINFNARG
jgi:hypothetical protein